MGSVKTYRIVFLFCFLLGTISISAQNRVQKLYSRSLMDGKKEMTSRSVELLVNGKNLKPLSYAYVSIIGYDLQWNTDAEGRVIITLPKEIDLDKIEIEVRSRKYFSKNIYVSFEGENAIYRSVHLKYNPKGGCFRVVICPNF